MLKLIKLIRLNKSSYVVTIPEKYRKTLGLEFGDYMEAFLTDSRTFSVRKHIGLEK